MFTDNKSRQGHPTNAQPRRHGAALLPVQPTVTSVQNTVVSTEEAKNNDRSVVAKGQKTFFAKQNHTPKSEIHNFPVQFDL